MGIKQGNGRAGVPTPSEQEVTLWGYHYSYLGATRLMTMETREEIRDTRKDAIRAGLECGPIFRSKLRVPCWSPKPAPKVPSKDYMGISNHV